jgi:dimethylargininase
MIFTHAILRTPGLNVALGLTTSGAGVPDHALALAQHAQYAEALQHAGLKITVLDPMPAFPDAYFVETSPWLCRKSP